jgi:hypothetical protein
MGAGEFAIMDAMWSTRQQFQHSNWRNGRMAFGKLILLASRFGHFVSKSRA